MTFTSFWQELGFTLPVVLGLGLLMTRKHYAVYRWSELFSSTRFEDLNQLYKKVNQMLKFVLTLKKS